MDDFKLDHTLSRIFQYFPFEDGTLHKIHGNLYYCLADLMQLPGLLALLHHPLIQMLQ